MNQLQPHTGQFRYMPSFEFILKMYSVNHPDTQVFNQDCNLFLSRAINHSPLEALDGRLHHLPGPGDVEIIYGGVSSIHSSTPDSYLFL